jgi:hypothetical protein
MRTWEVKAPGYGGVRVDAWTEKGARRHYRRDYAEAYPMRLDVREVTEEELAWEEDLEARHDAASY